MRAFGGHEIYPGEDPDQTRINTKSKEEEFVLRDIRNHLIKEKLQLCESVQYRSTGWSMYPLIHSEDTCVFEPVCGDPQLDQLPVEVDDCVFCEVQPSGRFYAHKILSIEYVPTTKPQGVFGPYYRRYQIGNMNRHVNGWCLKEHIYGRLVEVVSILPKEADGAFDGPVAKQGSSA